MFEDHWKVYYDNVKTRCLKLIKFGIWSGVDSNKLDAWLNNFETDREKYFSACILDSLIFRSTDQTISMLFDLLTRDLNNLFRSESVIYDNKTNPLFLLKNKYLDPQFRLVAAVKPNDPPSKSGYLMNSILVHQLGVYENWTITPMQINSLIENGITNFVLIDDIICTGDQICDTIETWSLDKYTEAKFYIATCAAHECGINRINEKYMNIKVAFTEELKYSNSFFETLDFQLSEYSDYNDAIDKYKSFLQKKGVKNKDVLGYGELGLVYGFDHNVPNASMPIIHYDCSTFSSLLNKRR